MQKDTITVEPDHYHKTPNGFVACYHGIKHTMTSWQFWLGVTFSFPIEHWLWTQVWGFRHIAAFMGLGIH